MRVLPMAAILAAGLGVGGPAGCGETPAAAPPKILFGQDVCDVCGMIISDDRFAAGVAVQADGRFETRAFDDIGCLLSFEQAQPGENVVGRYVADYRTRTWRDAEAAAYLHSADLHTPMAFGLAALDTVAQAQALGEEYPGDVIDFRAVRERYESGALTIFPDEDT